MKTAILLALFGLLVIVALTNGKNVVNQDDLEFNDKNARMFLRAMLGDGDSGDDDSDSFDTRQQNKNCVPCKFGVSPCCAPNICRKKRFRPDECIEIKPGK